MKYISLPKAYSEHNSYIYKRTSFTTQVEGGPCKRDLKECQKCFHACSFLILYIGEQKKMKVLLFASKSLTLGQMVNSKGKKLFFLEFCNPSQNMTTSGTLWLKENSEKTQKELRKVFLSSESSSHKTNGKWILHLNSFNVWCSDLNQTPYHRDKISKFVTIAFAHLTHLCRTEAWKMDQILL